MAQRFLAVYKSMTNEKLSSFIIRSPYPLVGRTNNTISTVFRRDSGLHRGAEAR